MTQSKRLLSKRKNIRFERVIDSAGKVTGYLVGGVRYASYAEARRKFLTALQQEAVERSHRQILRESGIITIAPSPDDTTSSRSGSS